MRRFFAAMIPVLLIGDVFADCVAPSCVVYGRMEVVRVLDSVSGPEDSCPRTNVGQEFHREETSIFVYPAGKNGNASIVEFLGKKRTPEKVIYKKAKNNGSDFLFFWGIAERNYPAETSNVSGLTSTRARTAAFKRVIRGSVYTLNITDSTFTTVAGSKSSLSYTCVYNYVEKAFIERERNLDPNDPSFVEILRGKFRDFAKDNSKSENTRQRTRSAGPPRG